MKIRKSSIAAALFGFLFLAVLLIAQAPPKPPAPAAAKPVPSKPLSETDQLKQQLHDATLREEMTSIKLLTTQMQLLNEQYNQTVSKMTQENPGFVWDSRAQQLVPAPKPPTEKKPEAK